MRIAAPASRPAGLPEGDIATLRGAPPSLDPLRARRRRSLSGAHLVTGSFEL